MRWDELIQPPTVRFAVWYREKEGDDWPDEWKPWRERGYSSQQEAESQRDHMNRVGRGKVFAVVIEETTHRTVIL